ncbi:unnamed protein product [Moneuplotes crassus]|uniref:CSC1/OSCA1-like cytosolic domain-containing protein n=1 Tax=Euplotes crassus TaxID=5936 RepID=A0AAD2D4I2_EUPCR|nr:unnamed protein product [Moneuplotes crassus]
MLERRSSPKKLFEQENEPDNQDNMRARSTEGDRNDLMLTRVYSENQNPQTSFNKKSGQIPSREQILRSLKRNNIKGVLNNQLNKIPPVYETGKYHGILDKVWLTPHDKEALENDQKYLKTYTVELDQDEKFNCACCKDQVGGSEKIEKFKFWTSIRTFKIFGTGIPMFFHFLIFLIILFGLLTIVVSIASIVLNLKENDKDELGVRSPTFLVYQSLGNHGITASQFEKSGSVNAIIILNLVGIFIIFLAYRIYRCANLKKAAQIDRETITPSNFTLFAYNINENISDRGIKRFLQNECEVPPEDIVDIIRCYNISKITSLVSKKILEEEELSYLALKHKRENEEKGYEEQHQSEDIKDDDSSSIGNEIFELNDEDPKDCDIKPITKRVCCFKITEKTIEQRYQRIQELRKEIEDYQCKITNSTSQGEGEFCKKAFIVFRTRKIANHVNDKLHIGKTKRLLKYICSKFSCCNEGESNTDRFQTRRAAEPSDVYWENLHISSKTHFRKSLISFMIMLCCLLVSFALNLGFGIFTRKTTNPRATSINPCTSYS